MKLSHLSLALILCLIVGCASPIERRLTRYPQLAAKLSPAERSDVAVGRIREGMSKDAVFLAWGRPARIHTGSRNGKPIERWSYNTYEPVLTHSFGASYGYGCYIDPFPFGAHTLDYVPVEGRTVEFVGDRAIGFTQLR